MTKLDRTDGVTSLIEAGLDREAARQGAARNPAGAPYPFPKSEEEQ